MNSQTLNLYAVVPADEIPELQSAVAGEFDLVAWGPFAAIVGAGPRQLRTTAAALLHDRVVQVAMEHCSTVLPFRLGTCLDDAIEVSSVLERNATGLTRQLHRLRGRVEMGMKARMNPPSSEGGPSGLGLRFFEGLGGLRNLAPLPGDRRERFTRKDERSLFDGRYLVARADVDLFWSAVVALRESMPSVPMLASGPWAPYSFAEVALVAGSGRSGEPAREVRDAPN
jgi:hypothetical protein